MVISHCDKSLDWIFEDLMSDNIYLGNNSESSSLLASPNIVSITVLSKCGWPVEGIPPKYTYKLVRLPNVERNDHSYAHWLLHQDPSVNPNNVVLFLKDNSNFYHKRTRQRSLRETVYIAQGNAGFGCREERLWYRKRPDQQIPTFLYDLWNGLWMAERSLGYNLFSCEISFFHYRSELLRFKMHSYNRLRRDSAKSFRASYADMGEWLEEAVFAGNPSNFSLLLSSSNTLVPVCYGGNFAARRS